MSPRGAKGGAVCGRHLVHRADSPKYAPSDVTALSEAAPPLLTAATLLCPLGHLCSCLGPGVLPCLNPCPKEARARALLYPCGPAPLAGPAALVPAEKRIPPAHL